MHACAKLVIAFRDYIGDWLRAPSHLVVPFLPDLICRRRHRVADPLGFCPAHAESLRGYLGGDLPDARDARERYKSAMHRLWIWVGTVRPRVRRVVGNDAQAELQRRQGAHGSVSRQARRPRKILVWDTSGLVLIWKQLQQGGFRWPPSFVPPTVLPRPPWARRRACVPGQTAHRREARVLPRSHR